MMHETCTAEELDLAIVRTFVDVVNEGSFKLAAARLHLSASAVSAQIKRLEENLGYRLLERSNQGLIVTPAGHIMLKHGRALLETNALLFADLDDDRPQGPITIGAPTDYTTEVIRRLVPSVQIDFPAVAPRIILEPSRKLRARLRNGEVDIAIAAHEPTDADRQILWTEPLSWFTAAEPSTTDTVPVAVLTTDCILRDITLTALERFDRPHAIVAEVATVDALVECVEARFAASLLPSSTRFRHPTHRLEATTPAQAISFTLLKAPHFDEQAFRTISHRIRDRVSAPEI